VLDILGRAVRTLQDGLLPAGSYSALWNGRDADGRQMGNGTYLVRLSTESMRETTKVMLIK
jgi:flagellar hook assembly protein FlgD